MEKNPSLEKINVVELKTTECVGIQSHVKRFSELKEETVTVGHVAFFDFENVDIKDVKDIIENYLGFGFIFNSHGDNYHVIVPAVRSIAEIKDAKDQIELDDDAHADIGVKKGCWTLRISEKGSKPRPKYVGYVQSSSSNPMTEILSKPHLEYIKERSSDNIAHNMLHECKTVGTTTNIVKYSTAENNHEAGER